MEKDLDRFLKRPFRYSKKNETIVSEKSEHDPSLTTLH